MNSMMLKCYLLSVILIILTAPQVIAGQLSDWNSLESGNLTVKSNSEESAEINPGDSSMVHIDEVTYGTLDDINGNITVTAQFEEVRSEVNESDTAFSINVVLSLSLIHI